MRLHGPLGLVSRAPGPRRRACRSGGLGSAQPGGGCEGRHGRPASSGCSFPTSYSTQVECRGRLRVTSIALCPSLEAPRRSAHPTFLGYSAFGGRMPASAWAARACVHSRSWALLHPHCSGPVPRSADSTCRHWIGGSPVSPTALLLARASQVDQAASRMETFAHWHIHTSDPT